MTNQGSAVAEELARSGEETEGGRPMRADARRNRERIVAAAREVFAEDGASASMEAIARRAGVGVGTLYRHFPNRFDVVEAVYLNDVDELTAAARHAVDELEPSEAMDTFFDAFLRYAQTKRTLLTELQQGFEKNPGFRSRCKERIDEAFDLVIDNARRAGVVRSDVEGWELTQLMSPVCTNPNIEPEQSRRLLGMILDGLRARS